jgi:hypothetical protein
MPGDCAVGDLRWALTDQCFGCDMSPCFLSGPCPRHPQRSAPAQAGHQLPFERTAALHIQRLVDGLVADPHGFIIGEIHRQPASDLFRTPRLNPGPITTVGLVAALPRCAGGAGHDLTVSTAHYPRQLIPDVLAQSVVADQLGDLGAPCTSLGMPLRGRGLVIEPIGTCGGVTAQLT